MSIWYIKELADIEDIFNEKKSKFWMKIVYSLKNMFNILTIKEFEDKKICILPIMSSNKNVLDKKLIRLAKKIKKRINVKDIVLSNYLNTKLYFKNELYSYNLNILDGRWLFSYLLRDSIEYISSKQEKPVEKQEISILVNDNSQDNVDKIVDIAQKVKMVNIITNDIKKFKKAEEYLYDNLGIMVRLTNNTKKALLKSNIIINLDFPEEMINKYSLPKNGVVLNIQERLRIQSKKFSGININYYNIQIPNKYINDFKIQGIYHKFSQTILYESIIYSKDSYKNILNKLNEDESRIVNLIGENGIIDDKEYYIEENLNK